MWISGLAAAIDMEDRWTTRLTVIALVGACFFLTSCRSCSSAPKVADLVAASGTVQRDWASTVGTWENTKPGADFHLGDGVRTRANAKARVKLVNGAVLRLASETQLRFLSKVPNSREDGIDVETGEALVEPGDRELMLRTLVGLAVIEPGSQVRLRSTQSGLQIKMALGQARIESGSQVHQLRLGDELTVAVGGALIESSAARPRSVDAGSSIRQDASVPSSRNDFAIEISGRGVRAKAPDATQWSPLTEGATTLAYGTALKIPRTARVHVRRGEEESVLTGPGDYTLGEGEGALVRAERGRVLIESHVQDVIVTVPGGTIVARASEDGTAAEVSIDKRTTQINVRRGTVEVQSQGGVEKLGMGDTAKLQRSGDLEIGGRGLSYSDFSVVAGESFTIRDPEPPTALGFRFGERCPKGANVELSRPGNPHAHATAHGENQASLLVQPGSFKYVVRCLSGGASPHGQTIASGTVRLIRDAGTERLPTTPPPTLVDTDGRRYTVLYQNLLPSLSIRWPRPPTATEYVLELRPSRGAPRVFRSATPSYEFAPGVVSEGRYVLVFRAQPAGPPPSKPTVLDVRFDNAAPKANVREPANGSFAQGSQVKVSGTTLEGWEVSVGGRTIAIDGQHRFNVQVFAPQNERAIAIRLAHPSNGVHYYLRRARP